MPWREVTRRACAPAAARDGRSACRPRPRLDLRVDGLPGLQHPCAQPVPARVAFAQCSVLTTNPMLIPDRGRALARLERIGKPRS